MSAIFDLVKNNPLFKNIPNDGLEQILSCLQLKRIAYRKNDLIMLAGTPQRFGLVLSGKVRVTREDMNGNPIILADISAPGLFNEVCVVAQLEDCPHTAYALEDSEVLMFDYKNIISTCQNCSVACPFHRHLLQNLLASIAQKAVFLDHRVELLSKRSIRDRVFYLFDAYRGGNKHFTLPFSRGEMARYINVDRSALSNELSKMQKEGLIQFKRNDFELL